MIKNNENSSIHVVIPHTTEHSIIGRLKKDFDEIKTYVLSQECYINPSSPQQIMQLMEEITESVKQLPEIRNSSNYHLLLTGFPPASIISYQALINRFNNISLLIFDSKTKKYIPISNVTQTLCEIWEKKEKENPAKQEEVKTHNV